MVEVTDIFLGIAVGLGSLNAILNTIVIRNFPVVRDIRQILKQLGGVLGLESVQQNIVPATNQVQPPNNSVASLLAGVQNQSPPDPIRETQEATIKFLQKDNRSLRNKMNRIFKKNEIENLEPDTDEGDGADDGEEGEMVTSENLDVEILKKFGAKIPALNNVNLNDPVARQTVAQMINGNSEYKKYYNAAKIIKGIIPHTQQAEQSTVQQQIEGFA